MFQLYENKIKTKTPILVVFAIASHDLIILVQCAAGLLFYFGCAVFDDRVGSSVQRESSLAGGQGQAVKLFFIRCSSFSLLSSLFLFGRSFSPPFLCEQLSMQAQRLPSSNRWRSTLWYGGVVFELTK